MLNAIVYVILMVHMYQCKSYQAPVQILSDQLLFWNFMIHTFTVLMHFKKKLWDNLDLSFLSNFCCCHFTVLRSKF